MGRSLASSGSEKPIIREARSTHTFPKRPTDDLTGALAIGCDTGCGPLRSLPPHFLLLQLLLLPSKLMFHLPQHAGPRGNAIPALREQQGISREPISHQEAAA